MSELARLREEYPQYDDVSDYDLATGLYETFYEGKIDKSDYFQYLGINQAYEEMSTADYALGLPSELLNAPLRGLGKGLLSAGAGLAHLADAGTNLIGLEDLIDSG